MIVDIKNKNIKELWYEFTGDPKEEYNIKYIYDPYLFENINALNAVHRMVFRKPNGISYDKIHHDYYKWLMGNYGNLDELIEILERVRNIVIRNKERLFKERRGIGICLSLLFNKDDKYYEQDTNNDLYNCIMSIIDPDEIQWSKGKNPDEWIHPRIKRLDSTIKYWKNVREVRLNSNV
jgi:hypothetical protein